MGLQTTLILLAIVFVAVVVISTRRSGSLPFSNWRPGKKSASRPRRRLQKEAPHLQVDLDDALENSEFEDELEPETATERDFTRETGTGRTVSNVRHLCSLIHQELPAGPDEKVQFTVAINGGKPLETKQLIKQLTPLMAEFEGQAECFGQSVFGQSWHNVMSDSAPDKFANLALCLPLAGANGELKASQFARLLDQAYQLGEAWGRKVHAALDLDQAEERAAEVQTFYDDYKVALYLNVLTRNDAMFDGRDIADIFQRQELQFDNGLFHKMSSDGEILYSVADLYNPGSFDQRSLKKHETGGLTVFMSLPLSNKPSASFAKMLQMTDALASGLGGDVYDPDFTPVSMPMVEQTSEEIVAVEEAMSEFGIEPGSDSALRLFGE